MGKSMPKVRKGGPPNRLRKHVAVPVVLRLWNYFDVVNVVKLSNRALYRNALITTSQGRQMSTERVVYTVCFRVPGLTLFLSLLSHY